MRLVSVVLLSFLGMQAFGNLNGTWIGYGKGVRMGAGHTAPFAAVDTFDCKVVIKLSQTGTALSLRRDTSCDSPTRSFADVGDGQFEMVGDEILCTTCTEQKVGSFSNNLLQLSFLPADPNYLLRDEYFLNFAKNEFSYVLRSGRDAWSGFVEAVTGELRKP